MGYAPRLNAEKALRNTRDLLDALHSAGVTAWVQDGTLLGLVRDGTVIPWDHDTDTGMFASDWSDACHDALAAAGFTLKKALGKRSNGWQHRWVRDGVKTDIFFYYPSGGGRVWHAAYVSERKQYRFTYDAFDVAPLETSAGVMLAPSPPEAFLVAKYGADWRTPKRKWHFAYDPLNASRA